MSSKKESGKKRPPADDSDDSDDDDGDFEEQPAAAKKRKKHQSLIDDAAEESGDEDEDEDEDEDDGVNDYVMDDFVTTEIVAEKRGVLEDSDDEGDDDDETPRKKKGGRIRKLKEFSELDEEDKLLIEEHRKEQQGIKGSSADEERGGFLFDDVGEDEDVIEPEQSRPRPAIEQFDEDGMDDFIEDDIGDQEKIRRSQKHVSKNADEVNEAQLNEASEIFGTDYLDFLKENEDDDEEDELMGSKKFRERGVGVNLEVASDEEVISSDEGDEDMFGDGDDANAAQRAEARKLHREKRKLAREERRRLAAKKRADRQKAQLRRAFEPVQLIENFCTERDDEIRQADVPERYFGIDIPFNEDEIEEESEWIASQIPALSSDSSTDIESIGKAIRYFHDDKLEPIFVKHYRKDYIPSKLVQDNIYEIFDQHLEWSRLVAARLKVESALDGITASTNANESVGETSQKLASLEAELQDARAKLDDTASQEAQVQAEVEALGEDEDDDELFGGDDDDEEAGNEEKKKNKRHLHSHLATIQSLLEARADKVTALEKSVEAVREQTRALSDPGPMERITKKTSRDNLWNSVDYQNYISTITESRHLVDINKYLNLLREGNEAIQKKEMPQLRLTEDGKDTSRRSRRYDHDFYRTCVAEGLRDVSYRFLLAPNRVGVKLEATVLRGSFDFSTKMPGEENESPMKWVPRTVSNMSPSEFCSELIGSGELVLLDADANGSSESKSDPLRGCRYVAAMELSHEPRVRRYLRAIFQKHVLLTTVPTKKGLTEIDAFHEYYGLHLIRGKPVKQHFPPEDGEVLISTLNLTDGEKTEYHREMQKREKENCIQYLKILKAEATGDVKSFLHLQLKDSHLEWYKDDPTLYFSRQNQVATPLLNELRKVYMPTDTDTSEWEKERMAVLQLALSNFLLPQFENEVRRDLREAATKVCVGVAGENLRTMAMVGPYRPAATFLTHNRFLEPTGDLPIVGVCCSNEAREATYLASVNRRGESTDYLAVPGGLPVDSHKTREKAILFLLQSRPAAVIVGTSGGFRSRQTQRKMTDLLAEAIKRWNNRNTQGDDEDDDAFYERQNQLRMLQPAGHYDEDDDNWTCNVELVDDSVAQLFGRSVRGKEFPEYAVNLKCAIAVARYAKDPLAELTYTWSVASHMGTFGTEMLFLNIHPMQQLLPKPMLLRQYERVLCESVAAVGCDVNACCEFDHLRGLLMFVPGLGPRKAANLKQSFSKLGGAVAKRRDLLENRLLGPVVYNNAVAYLKITDTDQLVDQVLNPLDNTRLHPDVYLRNAWAIKIAFDALEREEPRPNYAANLKAIRDVMDNSFRELERLYVATKSEWVSRYAETFNVQGWDPLDVPAHMWSDKVEELDLEAYADMIQKKGHGKWHSHLEMIKWEFRLPFADPRKPMQPLSGDRLFHVITGESDETLRPGKEITGKVVQNGEYGSKVKLDGDIPAFVPLKYMSDDRAESANDYLTPNQIVTAIVVEVKKDHMSVDLSLRDSDFRKKLSSWDRPSCLDPLDSYFDCSAANRLEEDNAKKREAHILALQKSIGNRADEPDDDKKEGLIVNRACTHERFRNLRHDEVDKILREGGDRMVGEALIRPSSKSSNLLALHWVVHRKSIMVIEVVEEDKETPTSIGKTLIVKEEKYNSIEELLVRYISPMNDYVEQLVQHRKFLDLDENDVDARLTAQKKANPETIPYAFCWHKSHPGYASLRFLRTKDVRRHLVRITPKGYTWEEKPYPSLDVLSDAFKKNPNGRSQNTPKSQQRTQSSSASDKPTQTRGGRWGDKPVLSTRPHRTRVSNTAPPVDVHPPAWNPPHQQPVAVGGGGNQWGQPPPPNVPRPLAYSQPPPPNLPPPQSRNVPVPPPFNRPAEFDNGPADPGQGRDRGRTPAAFDNGPADPGQGRGRGRTPAAFDNGPADPGQRRGRGRTPAAFDNGPADAGQGRGRGRTPAAFDNGPADAGQGRGLGRTLPAWMSKKGTEP